jgi:hypothetical protein
MKKNSFLFLFTIVCLAGFSQTTGTVTDPRDGRVYKTVKIGDQWIMSENLAFRPARGAFWTDTTYFEKDSKVSLHFSKDRMRFENGKVHLTVRSGDKIGNSEIPKLFKADTTYGYLIFDSSKYFGKELFDGYLVLDSLFFKRYGYLYDFEAARASAIPGWHVPTNDELKELLKFLGGNAKSHFTTLMEGGNSGFNAVVCGWGTYGFNGLKSRSITECQGSIWSSSKTGHLGVCLDFNGPPVLRPGAVRIGLVDVKTGLNVRLFKDR